MIKAFLPYKRCHKKGPKPRLFVALSWQVFAFTIENIIVYKKFAFTSGIDTLQCRVYYYSIESEDNIWIQK